MLPKPKPFRAVVLFSSILTFITFLSTGCSQQPTGSPTDGDHSSQASSRSSRPSKAVLGHWKTVLDEPGMRFPRSDFDLYIAPHEKGLLFTEVSRNGAIDDAFYVIDSENMADKTLTLTRLFRANETTDKREKLDDTKSYLQIDKSGRLIYSSMVWENVVLNDFDKANTRRIRQPYYTCTRVDNAQEP